MLGSSATEEATDPAHLSHAHLLPYHIQRILVSAEELQWQATITYLSQPDILQILASAIDAEMKADEPEPHTTSTFIVRVAFRPSSVQPSIMYMLNPSVDISFSRLFPTMFPPPFSFSSPEIGEDKENKAVKHLYLDTEPLKISFVTRHKTNHRQIYTAALTRVRAVGGVGITDVLIWNPEGELMETAFSNVYFWRDGGESS